MFSLSKSQLDAIKDHEMRAPSDSYKWTRPISTPAQFDSGVRVQLITNLDRHARKRCSR